MTMATIPDVISIEMLLYGAPGRSEPMLLSRPRHYPKMVQV